MVICKTRVSGKKTCKTYEAKVIIYHISNPYLLYQTRITLRNNTTVN